MPDANTLWDFREARIKTGESAADIWPDKPAKARQKDTDARWTVKVTKPGAGGQPRVDIAIRTFGYKSHISIDRRARDHPPGEGQQRSGA